MLFKASMHPQILRGEITLTYRNWTRAQARAGGRHRLHGYGVLEVTAVSVVRMDAISARDAKRAGFESREALLAELARWRPIALAGVYRIEFRFVPEADPRVELSQVSGLTADECRAIAAKLDRMDVRSAHGAWTRETIRSIANNPRVLAAKLAQRAGRERLAFKADVRKLKALGLTISHEIGYEISPRGRAFSKYEARSSAGRDGNAEAQGRRG